jgi:ferric-dicitrate binding protein FerR (iron transport regulator)
MPGGAEVTLAGDSEVGFPRKAEKATRRLRLVRGSLAVVVRPVGDKERLVVDAGEHQVIALDTEFSVTQKASSAPCVVVRRGVVEVRFPGRSQWLKAGEELGCELSNSTSKDE